jgi:hypothetical protein
MSRKPTVLTPPPPKRTRATREAAVEPSRPAPRPGTRYRVRELDESPFGGWSLPLYGDDLDVLERHADDLRRSGVRAVVEVLDGSVYRPAHERPPVLVADLAADGLARQHPSGGWEISPAGYARIRGDR